MNGYCTQKKRSWASWYDVAFYTLENAIATQLKALVDIIAGEMLVRAANWSSDSALSWWNVRFDAEALNGDDADGEESIGYSLQGDVYYYRIPQMNLTPLLGAFTNGRTSGFHLNSRNYDCVIT